MMAFWVRGTLLLCHDCDVHAHYKMFRERHLLVHIMILVTMLVSYEGSHKQIEYYYNAFYDKLHFRRLNQLWYK